jgi:hypothetical protein
MKITVSKLRDLISQYDNSEISISRFAEIINDDAMHELVKANNLIRSFHADAERSGADTNWEGLMMQIDKVLKEQHRIMYPENYKL